MLNPELEKIMQARHHNPFAVLGRQVADNDCEVTVYLPYAQSVTLADNDLPMQRIPQTDFFEWYGDKDQVPAHYRLRWLDCDQQEHRGYDPYCFPPLLKAFDLHLFNQGKHWHIYNHLGAHIREINDIKGVLFAVWAPNAERVSVVGDFNRWDGRCHPMRVHGGSGVWELFIPSLAAEQLYKFEIRNRNSGEIFVKSDPYARFAEKRPNTSSIVTEPSAYVWQDEPWLAQRTQHDCLHQPMSVYEVHLGSWQRDEQGQFLNYRELAHRLVAYVQTMGFSYIELLPISEHPLDESWGYQTTGYFSPTSRFGTPDDLRYFVDYCHQYNIGVLLDWVPAHFPKDQHGLARFDGSALYEHVDPRKGEHLDWSTLIYNYERHEVKNFLLANALYWLDLFHFDGLRVDAVASMLYLDYSREEWIPNKYGGRENLEAIAFFRELNEVAHKQYPGTVIMAEESTSWPQVTRPTWLGGLGFSMKWNMGWMNDTLSYMQHDPIYRKYHHESLSFSMLYAFTENFILPFSHDEVVHGKGSMLNKMPGDEWQKFANLRLLYSYMFTHPGKKLLFMGTEFAQGSEWDCSRSLDWYVLNYPAHQGVKRLVADLNHLYHQTPALYHHEFEWQGFDWIDCHDAEQSVLSYVRKTDDNFVVVLLNFTPAPRHDYRIGVPQAGEYVEIFNSDSGYYGGSNLGNGGTALISEAQPWMNKDHSLTISLPPLAGIVLQLKTMTYV